MGIKPPKKTTTGFSTAADVLETLKEESPIVKEILEYRTLEKLRSTYVDALPEQINPQHTPDPLHFQPVCRRDRETLLPGPQSAKHSRPHGRGEKNPRSVSSRRNPTTASSPPTTPRSNCAFSPTSLKTRANQSLPGRGGYPHLHRRRCLRRPLKRSDPRNALPAKTVNFGILYGQQAFGLSQQLGDRLQRSGSISSRPILSATAE